MPIQSAQMVTTGIRHQSDTDHTTCSITSFYNSHKKTFVNKVLFILPKLKNSKRMKRACIYFVKPQ